MLVVEENYVSGVPASIVAGWAPTGSEWHWSAGGAGRVGWDATVRYLIATRSTINASYHGGMWPEHKVGHVGCRTILQWIVPTTRAAHSTAPSQIFKLNPNKSASVQQARFTEVRRILGAKALDPNAAVIAIAYAGMPTDMERDLGCSVFRDDVQELGRQLVAHPSVIDRPHFGHGWIQPIDRYEMDVATDFIGMLYGGITEVPVILRPVYEEWTTRSSADGSAGYFTTDGPGQGERKWFTTPERVRSYAETADAKYRAIAYGAETLWMERTQLAPIPGTRNPATGYGLPSVSTGYSVEQMRQFRAKVIAEYSKAGTAAATAVAP